MASKPSIVFQDTNGSRHLLTRDQFRAVILCLFKDAKLKDLQAALDEFEELCVQVKLLIPIMSKASRNSSYLYPKKGTLREHLFTALQGRSSESQDFLQSLSPPV
jgi:hypothetical protein